MYRTELNINRPKENKKPKTSTGHRSLVNKVGIVVRKSSENKLHQLGRSVVFA